MGNTICPYCEFEFIHIRDDHIEKCSRVPPTEELVKMFDEDKSLTLNKLRIEYGIPSKYIERRLHNTKWTKEKLADRGVEVVKAITHKLADERESVTFQSEGKIKKARKLFKKGKLKKCRCGILINLEEKLCKFCQMDEAGIITYKDLNHE